MNARATTNSSTTIIYYGAILYPPQERRGLRRPALPAARAYGKHPGALGLPEGAHAPALFPPYFRPVPTRLPPDSRPSPARFPPVSRPVPARFPPCSRPVPTLFPPVSRPAPTLFTPPWNEYFFYGAGGRSGLLSPRVYASRKKNLITNRRALAQDTHGARARAHTDKASHSYYTPFPFPAPNALNLSHILHRKHAESVQSTRRREMNQRYID